MIKITIEDTENRGEPLVLTGKLGFAVVKTGEEENIVRTGSVAMGEIDFFNMPRDIAAMGKETRHVMQNLDDDKANSVIRVLAFKCGFEEKEGQKKEMNLKYTKRTEETEQIYVCSGQHGMNGITRN